MKQKATTLDQNYSDELAILNGSDAEESSTGGNEELIARLNEWFEEAKQARSTQEDRWRKNEKLYSNNIDMTKYPIQAVMKFNIPFAVVQTILPIINDYLPSYDVMPDAENDRQFADMIQKRCEQIQKTAQSRSVDMDVIEDSLKYSNGIKEIIPELNENGSMVGIRERSVDPFTWYPAPHSTGLDIKTESRYQIFATPMHLDEIEKEYDIRLHGEGELDDQRAFVEVDKGNDDDINAGKYSLVKTCYWMDDDIEKYPNGRMVTWAEDKILADNEIPYIRIPFFMVKNYGDSHSVYGVGEPELVEHGTAAINYGMSSIYDNISEFGNPIRRVKRNLWNTFKHMMTRRRRTLVVDQTDDITYLQPPAINQTTFGAIELTMRLVDIISGVHDVMEGRRPTGVTAASAITALQEAAQARVRYKITKEIKRYTQEYGSFIVWLVQEYDTETKQIRVRDQASGSYQFIEYDPNMRIQVNGELRTMRDSHFDIEVTTGFREPTGRAYTKAEALEKFKIGIYGIEDYVMASNESNKEEMIQRYYERQGMVQTVEQLKNISKSASQMSPEEWEVSNEKRQLFEMMGQMAQNQ